MEAAGVGLCNEILTVGTVNGICMVALVTDRLALGKAGHGETARRTVNTWTDRHLGNTIHVSIQLQLQPTAFTH